LILLIWLFENEDDDEYDDGVRISRSSSLAVPTTTVKSATMKSTAVKSTAVKMMNTEVVAVEMVVSVVVVVMTPAKDIVAAAVWSPATEIRSRVRTSDIGPAEISALTSG
jgi:hypothetical protein